MMQSSWDIVCNKWTDRQTDGRTDEKSDIQVGAPPKQLRVKQHWGWVEGKCCL